MPDASHFRRRERRPLEQPVAFLREEDGVAREGEGVATDLGLGGAFILTNDLPEPGTRVTLRIASASTWEPLELPAEVRWLRDGTDGPRGFGVRFVALDGPAATALYELIHASAYGEEST